jgi:hypothetical protein
MGWLGGVVTASRVAAATAILGISVAAALVVASEGDVGRLVHAAPPNADPAAVPVGLPLRPTDEGFDGMFYYRVAASPLSTADWVNGIRLDLPALRSSRVLYPAVSGAASLGDESRLPWTLLGVNLAAFCAVGYFGARVAEDMGRRPEWGLLFAAYPGFVYTLGRDLTELTEAALVLAGLHLVHRHRYLAAGLVLAGAVLAKETGIIVPFGIGLAWVWAQVSARWRPSEGQSRPSLAAAAPVLVPSAVFVCWHLVVWARFGASAISANSDNNLRLPLAGLAPVSELFVPTTSAGLFRGLSLAVLLLVAAAAALAWRRTQADLGTRLAWAAAVGLLLVISENVYGGATSFMRAGTESYVLGLTVLLGTRHMVLVALTPPIGVLATLTVGSELVKAA